MGKLGQGFRRADPQARTPTTGRCFTPSLEAGRALRFMAGAQQDRVWLRELLGVWRPSDGQSEAQDTEPSP